MVTRIKTFIISISQGYCDYMQKCYPKSPPVAMNCVVQSLVQNRYSMNVSSPEHPPAQVIILILE